MPWGRGAFKIYIYIKALCGLAAAPFPAWMGTQDLPHFPSRPHGYCLIRSSPAWSLPILGVPASSPIDGGLILSPSSLPCSFAPCRDWKTKITTPSLLLLSDPQDPQPFLGEPIPQWRGSSPSLVCLDWCQKKAAGLSRKDEEEEEGMLRWEGN